MTLNNTCRHVMLMDYIVFLCMTHQVCPYAFSSKFSIGRHNCTVPLNLFSYYVVQYFFHQKNKGKLIDFFIILIQCLGAGAVEFIICHSEISVAFVEEKKLPEVQNCGGSQKFRIFIFQVIYMLFNYGSLLSENGDSVEQYVKGTCPGQF